MEKPLLFKFRAALIVTVAIALATSALAQATMVIGTGNPDADVPAVQAAVNLGGEVVLMGHFSFDTPPTIPTIRLSLPPLVEVGHETSNLGYQRRFIAFPQPIFDAHPNEMEMFGFVWNHVKRSPERLLQRFLCLSVRDLPFVEPVRQFKSDGSAVLQAALDIWRIFLGLSPTGHRAISKQWATAQERSKDSLLFGRVSHYASNFTLAENERERSL